jgi:hypothetical protein
MSHRFAPPTTPFFQNSTDSGASSSKMKLGVFFSYFGGKFMRSPHYPAPLHDTIVEPFAGAAGYATRHYQRKVILVDASPYVAGVWRFLIASSPADILALPLMQPGQDVNSLPICQEARWLLGFWINQGSSVPKRTMGGRASNRQFGTWGEKPRERLAAQVGLIKHWRFIEGDYSAAPNIAATWFIDPPYADQGKQYPKQVQNFAALADWCRARQGQVMVCESEGANWLPFKPITTVAGATHRVTTEMLWRNAA